MRGEAVISTPHEARKWLIAGGMSPQAASELVGRGRKTFEYFVAIVFPSRAICGADRTQT